MEFWRCTTCAHLAPTPSPCLVCGGERTRDPFPPLPPSSTVSALEEAFRLQAGNVLLLEHLAEGAAATGEAELAAVLSDLAQAERADALQICLQAGILPDRGLAHVLQSLVSARVEAFPRFAEEAEREGHPWIAAHLKWLASRKAPGAATLSRFSP